MTTATKSTDKIAQNLIAIEEKVLANIRISTDECLYLYEHADLGFVGKLANIVRERKNGNYTFFNRNFHIEPTNICVFDCKFCSYSRLLKQKEEGWELSEEQIIE
jgi:aminodeoxyfutalosine synthase